MFRWCAYCQTFMGESEPRSNLNLTHGICPKCKSASHGELDSLAVAAQPLIEFFSSLRRDLLVGQNPNPITLLKKAKEIGISPTDLVAGVMQPLLDEIANLQKAGNATIQHEHEFSKVVDGVLHEIHRAKEETASYLSSDHADVLLACYDGNYHVFGVRLIAEYLTQAGISTKCLFPSSPFSEIIAAARSASASVIGISVYSGEQAGRLLDEWRDSLASEQVSAHGPYLPSLLIGGPGTLKFTSLPERVHIHSGSLIELRQLVDRLLSASQSRSESFRGAV